MTLVTLADVLKPAIRHGYAIAGLVTLGWEDMRAFVTAAEAEGCPVILQAGPSCRSWRIWIMATRLRNAAKRLTEVSHR